MNVQSNLYTFIYATVLVIVVALGLAFTSISLKEKQEANIEKEKKQNILASIGVECTRDEAVTLYKEYVKDVYAIDFNGEKVEGDAFIIDLNVEQAKAPEERQYPVYECEKDGEKIYVFPVRGKGLWGPIWGYVALKEDFNTIYGVTFDHKGETPGLGAEITTKEFQSQFLGKKIFDDTGAFVSILVKKAGKADPEGEHEVDGLSGSTLTCKGLEAMLYDSLIAYENFFKSHKK
ncbi:MAG: NADH:ubiquinone reductase (Na(+)-transporting) subunit C [Bacteroidales bacterium]|nr:NADH:ubiquinone reductase (Na(+)-transporting) subunit C [Bacteroidales bacterium]